jgi:hypothetical protein
MIATTRPRPPPPMAIGRPAEDIPRRSETCDGSSRAFRRIRMPRFYPHRASEAVIGGGSVNVSPGLLQLGLTWAPSLGDSSYSFW